MALLECPFLLLVLGPVFLHGQRLASRRAFEDAAPALDERGGHGFEKDSLGCGLNHGLCPVLDVELFAQAKWDDDLTLRREPYGVWLLSRTHTLKYDIVYRVRQYIDSRIIALWEESRWENSGTDGTAPISFVRADSPNLCRCRRPHLVGVRIGVTSVCSRIFPP